MLAALREGRGVQGEGLAWGEAGLVTQEASEQLLRILLLHRSESLVVVLHVLEDDFRVHRLVFHLPGLAQELAELLVYLIGSQLHGVVLVFFALLAVLLILHNLEFKLLLLSKVLL